MKAVSALLGTLIGVTATVAIAWINQRTLKRRQLIRDERQMRQTLYGEFIAECARRLVDAFQHSLEKPDTFVPVYALINRIRLCASQPCPLSALSPERAAAWKCCESLVAAARRPSLCPASSDLTDKRETCENR